MTTTEFYNAAGQMVDNLIRVARANPDVWQKDAIQSPLGPLVTVEFVSAVNDVYRIAGGPKTCVHWQGVSIMNDIMRAAGYVRK